MIIFSFIIIALASFLVGYFVSFNKSEEKRPNNTKKQNLQKEQIIKEFENFLSYDGSEQL